MLARGIFLRPGNLLLGLAISLALVMALSLLVGRYSGFNILALGGVFEDELGRRLVLNLRLPRILTAALLGMSLAVAGEVMQMIFANPLVEPGFLGVSQGAAFGAAVCIIFLGNQAWLVQLSAALFAFLGLAFSHYLARRIQFGGWVLRLVLAGIAVSALFSSAVGVLKYLADPLSQLPEITFWLLGGLYGVTWPQLLAILPAVLIGLGAALAMRWRLNLLSLQDQTAFSLGLAPERERVLLLGAAVVITAAVVSVSGMVGWVGLIVPHLARRIFGADTRYALPGAMWIGGLFVVLCDDLARTLLAGEIPLGVLTSLFGALGFIFLMSRGNLQVQR
ncbi:MAG: iron ABC transporter permease [Anaerolineales bacterium]|nr:iron ABC transporter permease [Anaerolineales bacterium]